MQQVIDIIENTKDLLQQKKPDGFEGMIDELTRASALVTTEGQRFDSEKQALLEKLAAAQAAPDAKVEPPPATIKRYKVYARFMRKNVEGVTEESVRENDNVQASDEALAREAYEKQVRENEPDFIEMLQLEATEYTGGDGGS